MMLLVHLCHTWEICTESGLEGGMFGMMILVHFYLWDSDMCRWVGREVR